MRVAFLRGRRLCGSPNRFAKVLDFAAERKLLASGVSLRHVFIEIPHLPEESVELQRTSVTTWPPFIVKVDALSLSENAPENLAEPAQTIVDSGRSDFSATHVQQLACVIHELLGGLGPALHRARLLPD